MRATSRLGPVGIVAIFGLTGSIGSGKSALARELASLGAAVVDADQVAHSLLSRGRSVRREVQALFGDGVMGPEGRIDRDRLGALVFADPLARRALEQVLHPRILRAVARRVCRLVRAGARVVILEAALIFETGLESELDGTIAVVSRRNAQLERLGRERGLDPERALARIAAQGPSAWKARRADWVVHNDSTLQDLGRAARNLWAELLGHPATRSALLMPGGRAKGSQRTKQPSRTRR